MAAAERYRRDDHIPLSDVVDDRAGEFSNDSDDSSERARYAEIITFIDINSHLTIATGLKEEVITISDQLEY